MSYRTQIKEAVKAKLLAALPGAGVYTSLDRALSPESDLPAVMIYATSSVRGRNDFGNSLIPRMVSLSVEGAVKSTPGNEIADAEAFADSIEDALQQDRSLGGVVNDCRWEKDQCDATAAGEYVLGVCLLEFSVEIFTKPKPDGYYEFGDDGYANPPTSVITVPGVTDAVTVFPTVDPPADTACGPDGCNIPAWAGEQ